MHVVLILKSAKAMRLDLYDDRLVTLESDSFQDLYTLNFHLQTLSKKHKISQALMVVHDADKNKVDLALAQDDQSFFVS